MFQREETEDMGAVMVIDPQLALTAAALAAIVGVIVFVIRNRKRTY